MSTNAQEIGKLIQSETGVENAVQFINETVQAWG